MSSSSVRAIVYTLLTGLCVATFLIPSASTPQSASALPQTAPTSYRLTGIIRDFRSSHPDFGLASAAGYSVAGNVDAYLGADGTPIAMNIVESQGSNGLSTSNVTVSKWGFDGSGSTVTDNKGSHDGVALNGASRNKGRFGKAILLDGIDDYVEVPHHADFLLDVGTVAFWFNVVDENTPQGLVSKDSTGFDTGGHFTIRVDGGQVIWRLQTTNSSHSLQSAPGSVQVDTWHHVAASFGTTGMRLFLDNELVDEDPTATTGLGTSSGGAGNFEPWGFGVNTWQTGNLNGTGWIEPLHGMLDEVQIFTGIVDETDYQATGGFMVSQQWTNGAGDVIAPHLYGAAWCSDGGTPAPCFDPSTDVQGAQGKTMDSQISSLQSFEDWFTDVLGVNLSSRYTIEMVQDADGVYEFKDAAFDPISGQLAGNEGADHNANFTYAIEATFTYEQCTGQFVEFSGGDGAWLYLDGRLALDLGGVAAYDRQLIELDRLCLQDGADYSFHFFYANRQSIPSEFVLRTNIWLRQASRPYVVSAPFD